MLSSQVKNLDTSLPKETQTAISVLKMEADAIYKLSESLDERFLEAIEAIYSSHGHLIITGMGKSGHIGKKIAATMASTGTPSFFVHPAEASHGDMGMVTKEDVVIAISNSGEAKELSDIIEYTKRTKIPLIAITSKEGSSLGSQCDILLLLPEHQEACPNGQAPTTSTTLTLALGDALAVSLLEKKGFTAKDFKKFHPGGKLGQQLLKVSEIMHKGDDLPCVKSDLPVEETINVINEKSLGCTAVVDNNNDLVGVITDGDIRRHIGIDIMNKTAGDIMSTNPKTISQDTLVAEAMAIMNGPVGSSSIITSLLVLDDGGKLAGVLHMHACLRAGIA